MKKKMIHRLPRPLTHIAPTKNQYLAAMLVVYCENLSQGCSPRKGSHLKRGFDLPNTLPRKKIRHTNSKNSIIGLDFKHPAFCVASTNLIFNWTPNFNRINWFQQISQRFQLSIMHWPHKRHIPHPRIPIPTYIICHHSPLISSNAVEIGTNSSISSLFLFVLSLPPGVPMCFFFYLGGVRGDCVSVLLVSCNDYTKEK